MICPNCQREESQISTGFGVIPCKTCQTRHRASTKPSNQIEFTTQEVKDGRKECARDILQPFHSDELSKEYLEAHGDTHIKVTPEEKAKAKNVWDDLSYYKK